MTPRKGFLAALLFLFLFIAGCSGGGNACTAGAACEYYQGSEGIDTRLENPPNTLYYYSTSSPQENSVEIPLQITNRGASAAYGATFFSGLPPEYYDLYTISPDGQKVPFGYALNNGCAFQLGGISLGGFGNTFGNLFQFALSGNCDDFFVRATEDGVSAGASVDTILGPVFDELGIESPPGQIDININDGKVEWGFSVEGLLIDVWNYGKVLVSIASQFNLEKYNGAVFILPGQNPESPAQNQEFPGFKVEMTDWPSGTEEIRNQYIVRTCYAYTTFVSPNICIDTNPNSNTRDKVCRANRNIGMGSQGAPVAVTNIEQRSTGRGVILDFTVANVGSGRVIDIGYLQACSPYYPGRVTRAMYDVVYVGQAYIGNEPLDCTAERIRLQNGRARFTCRYDLSGTEIVQTAYEIPLKMELWYAYEESQRRTLISRRVG